MLGPIPFKRHVLLLLSAFLMHTPWAHATLIALQPSSTYATTGDSISLDLVISGLGNFGPDSLGAFDISVGYDPGVLTFTSYSLGNFLGNIALAEAINSSTGNLGSAVNVSEISLLSAVGLDALQPSAFTLATLNFNVTNLAAGTVTQLSLLSGTVLADGFGALLPTMSGAPVSIAAISEPGTAFLLIASMFSWLTLKRR